MVLGFRLHVLLLSIPHNPYPILLMHEEVRVDSRCTTTTGTSCPPLPLLLPLLLLLLLQ